MSDRGQRLKETADKAGLNPTYSSNVQSLVWMKFLLIATMSSITTSTRKPSANSGRSGYPPVIVASLEESIAVGRAMGVDLPEDAMEQQLKRIADFPGPWWRRCTTICTPTSQRSWNGCPVRSGDSVNSAAFQRRRMTRFTPFSSLTGTARKRNLPFFLHPGSTIGTMDYINICKRRLESAMRKETVSGGLLCQEKRLLDHTARRSWNPI